MEDVEMEGVEMESIEMEKNRNNIKESGRMPLYLIWGCILFGLFLQIIEYGAHRLGLELRTWVQVIKGTYLWLVMPFMILYGGNALAGRLAKGKFKWLRGIVTALFVIGILFAGFIRGAAYAFSSEMVTETVMEDGCIQGTWSDFLSETRTDYYESVFLIFRRPFPGWTKEQLIEKVHTEYNKDAEFVEEQKDGIYVFRIPDGLRKDSYVYFHVSDSYTMKNNYVFQVVLNNALDFWGKREREISLDLTGRTSLEEARDTGEETDDAGIIRYRKFFITCLDTEEDIENCAADLVRWYTVLGESGLLPEELGGEDDDILTYLEIGSRQDHFGFLVYPLQDFLGEDTEETKYKKMKARLTEAFDKHNENIRRYEEMREEADSEMSGSETDAGTGGNGIDSSGQAFMNRYDGSYEKECLVEEGRIRYRMVVMDAALGNRFYGLLKSTDGGDTWEMSNSDPFRQNTGMGIDFIFLSEDFGFASLVHGGGNSAQLYVTEDGGDSFELVEMEKYTVTLEDGSTFEPYDYPKMPYEEDGKIYVLCGQGMDGDYVSDAGAGPALYSSMDHGHTFTFERIIQKNELE